MINGIYFTTFLKKRDMKLILIILFNLFVFTAVAQTPRQKEIRQRKEVIRVDSAQVEKIHKMPMDTVKTIPMPIVPKMDTVNTPGKDSIYKKTSF